MNSSRLEQRSAGPPGPSPPRFADDGTQAAEGTGQDCWNHIGVQGDQTCPELIKYVHCRNCPVFAAAGARLFERELPADWLDEQTRHLAMAVAPADTHTTAMLVFCVADEWLALPVCDVMEVAAVRPVHSVPHRSSSLFEGLVNIRGSLQLCFSLAQLLGMNEPRPPNAEESPSDPGSSAARPMQRMIVVQHRQDRWVFRADKVAGVHHVPLSQLAPLPATVERSATRISRAIFAWEAHQVGCLDTARVFSFLEDVMAPYFSPSV